MQQVQDGQCGLCSHFGEHHLRDQSLIQIRKSHTAPRPSWTSAATRATHRSTSR